MPPKKSTEDTPEQRRLKFQTMVNERVEGLRWANARVADEMSAVAKARGMRKQTYSYQAVQSYRSGLRTPSSLEAVTALEVALGMDEGVLADVLGVSPTIKLDRQPATSISRTPPDEASGLADIRRDLLTIREQLARLADKVELTLEVALRHDDDSEVKRRRRP